MSKDLIIKIKMDETEKFQKAIELLNKAFPYLVDHYDGYYGEQPETRLAKEIKEFLNA